VQCRENPVRNRGTDTTTHVCLYIFIQLLHVQTMFTIHFCAPCNVYYIYIYVCVCVCARTLFALLVFVVAK